MTTIAANRKCMASDKKCTDDGTFFRNRKIRRVGDVIVGAGGDGGAIGKFFVWFEAGADPEDLPKYGKDEALVALVLTPAGLFTYDTSGVREEIEDDFYACGSGKQAALAAMHLGCDPKRAVEIASLVDDATGLGVDVLELD